MNINYYNKALITPCSRIREGREQFSFGGWIQGAQPQVVKNPLRTVKMLSWMQCPLVPCSSDQRLQGKWHFGIRLWTTSRLEISLVCSRLQLLKLNSVMKNQPPKMQAIASLLNLGNEKSWMLSQAWEARNQKYPHQTRNQTFTKVLA